MSDGESNGRSSMSARSSPVAGSGAAVGNRDRTSRSASVVIFS